MATVTSASSSTSTNTTPATKPGAGIVNILGGGSGIDIQGLAQKLVAAEQHHGHRVAGSHLAADDLHAFHGLVEAGAVLAAVPHAEGRVDGDHHPGPPLAGKPRALGPGRTRQRENQQQQRHAAQQQQQKVAQLDLAGAHPHAAVEELHRSPVGVPHLVAVEQVREDGQCDAQGADQQEWIEETHNLSGAAAPPMVDSRSKKNWLSTASSGREVSTSV